MGQWDEKLKNLRDAAALDEARKKYAEDIEFYKMLQYLFFKQWRELKAYANENGIEIIGDVPIYVAGDSADVWANPKQFYLDEDLNRLKWQDVLRTDFRQMDSSGAIRYSAGMK